MLEDRAQAWLSHDEMVRLECLAKAISSRREVDTPDDIVDSAKQFEDYVRAEQR